MRLAHRFAIESEQVTGDMVEVTEFPHLAQRYQVRGVPRTVVNDVASIDGAVPEELFLQTVLEGAARVS